MLKIQSLNLFICLLSFIAVSYCQTPPDECLNPPEGSIIISNTINTTYGNLTINSSTSVVVISDVTYGCTLGAQPINCTVNISAKTVCLMDNVTLIYPQIILNATDIYINNSKVSASGTILGGIGSNIFTPEVGFSYAGFGGYCSSSSDFSPYFYNFFTYGSLFDVWNVSMSKTTFGTGDDLLIDFGAGGKIVILSIDRLEIYNSEISAAGAANCSNGLQKRPRAGTGGYIFISMLNDSGVLNIGSSYYDVSGGKACVSTMVPGLAGSGGRLQFDLQTDISKLNISNDGGYLEAGDFLKCQAAAPGTNYNFRTKTLIVKKRDDWNNTFNSGAMTVLDGTLNVTNVIVEGYVWLMSLNTSQSWIQAENFTLTNNVKFTPLYFQNYGTNFTLVTTGCFTLVNSSIILQPFTVTNIKGDSILILNSLIEGARIYLEPYSNLALQSIDIRNSSITDSKKSRMPTAIFLFSYSISISNTNLTANYIHLAAVKAVIKGKTQVKALQISCKGDPETRINNPIISSYEVHNSTTCDFNMTLVIEKLLGRQIGQFLRPSDFFEFAGKLSSDYTMILMTSSNLELQEGSKLTGSRVGVFGNDVKFRSGSKVSSNALGCRGGAGFSSGLKDEQFASFCGGSGGSYGGIGGIGSSNDPSKEGSCQKMKTFPYGIPSNPIFEGSGGSNTITCTGGSGGGVVIVGAYDLVIDGEVSSNGVEGSSNSNTKNNCGGGSGGSVQIHSLSRLTGHGNITAIGGRSAGAGGPGGAGRILLNYYGWFRNEGNGSIFDGSIIALIGESSDSSAQSAQPSYSLGTVYANPCLPGYYGLYCQPCPVGTYKDDFSNDECKACINNPENSALVSKGEWNSTNYLCPYTCDDMTLNEGGRSICLNYFQYYTRFVGGLPGVSILVFFCIIVAGLIFHKNSSKRTKKAKRVEGGSKGNTLPKVLPDKIDQLKKSSLKPDFVMEDLPYHTARVYLNGCNHTTQSWYLSEELPSSLKDKIDEAKYSEFIIEINSRCLWTNAEIILISLSEIIYYPIYAFALKSKKKRVLRKIQEYLGESKRDIWKDMRARELSYTIKFSSSHDCSLAYLDILNYDYSVLEWENTTKFPISVILCGEGNFLSPYQIDTNDPLVKSVSLALKQLVGLETKDDYELEGRSPAPEDQSMKRMELFLMTFNTLIREVDHGASQAKLVKSMTKLLRYIRTANIKFFNNSKIETELMIHFCPRGSKDQPVVSYVLNPFDENLEELLSTFRNIHLNSSTYDIQLSINFSRGDDIILSKHSGPQGDELEEEEHSVIIDEDMFAEEYKGFGDDYEESRSSRLSILDTDTIEMLDLKSKLLKKLETRRKNIQTTMISTQTQMTLPKESLHEDWKKLRKVVRWIEAIRYHLFSYRAKKFDKYFLTIVMSILVVLDLVYSFYMLTLIGHYPYIFLAPYPLSPLSPILGLLSLLFSSQIKIGKFFLMWNAMSIANIFIVFWTIPQRFLHVLDIVAKILLCAFGCHYISYLEHLKCLNDLDKFLE